jgi:hypothetical protein
MPQSNVRMVAPLPHRDEESSTGKSHLAFQLSKLCPQDFIPVDNNASASALRIVALGRESSLLVGDTRLFSRVTHGMARKAHVVE